MFWLLVLAFAAINALTVLRFWQDKQFARTGARRVPEAELLQLAMLGGSPGALLARQVFRHKTRKQPFSTQLMIITAVQVMALIGLLVFRPR